MGDFKGSNKTHSYFEGWYFKHQSEGHTLALIPGVNFDSSGKKSAFVQVITQEHSWNVSYPYSTFRSSPYGLTIQIGDQLFSSRGVRLNLQAPGLECCGSLRYGPLTPPQSDVMGPFRFVPFMECSHGVISMRHTLTGSLSVNGTSIDFNEGTGYIEKDRGSSFPEKYLWVQCNRFPELSCSIMVSIAKIPFGFISFTGCIAVVCFRGREYRLATYNGVRVLRWNESGFLISQRDYILEAEVLKTSGLALNAPAAGAMSRVIRESASCRVRFRFYRANELLFDMESDEAGFECAE